MGLFNRKAPIEEVPEGVKCPLCGTKPEIKQAAAISFMGANLTNYAWAYVCPNCKVAFPIAF